MPGGQLGPLAGVQLGRIEAEQHHLPGPQQRVPGAEPGQPRRPAAEHVGHAHRVGHRRAAALRGGEVRVSVEVHQPALAEPVQRAQRDRAVAAQDQRQPPGGADRRYLGRDPPGHLDDPIGVTKAADRLDRAVRRRREVAAVLDVEPGRAQRADQPGRAPGGRALSCPGLCEPALVGTPSTLTRRPCPPSASPPRIICNACNFIIHVTLIGVLVEPMAPDVLVWLVNEWGSAPRAAAGEDQAPYPDAGLLAGLLAGPGSRCPPEILTTQALRRTADRLHPSLRRL